MKKFVRPRGDGRAAALESRGPSWLPACAAPFYFGIRAEPLEEARNRTRSGTAPVRPVPAALGRKSIVALAGLRATDCLEKTWLDNALRPAQPPRQTNMTTKTQLRCGIPRC